MIRALRLLSREVLGLNRRNRDVVGRYNPRPLFQVVDHKLKAKEALRLCQLPVVETLQVYRYQRDLSTFADHAQQWNEFVIKPAQGAGGEGVIVVTDRQGETFVTADGRHVRLGELQSHLCDILGGVFSLNQRYDEAIVERRIHPHPLLARLSFQGVPDIRVIVFRGVPLMAMVRLATRASRGRANLHLGGIGVGVDLLTGMTTHAVLGRQELWRHPDTEEPLCGVSLPHWQELLTIAARCADAVPLGYLGVDLTLDAHSGPYVLELNARPGLSIQLANRRGLRPLLEAVETRMRPGLSAQERVRLGQELAAGGPRPHSPAACSVSR
ncbi:MAG: alpha-L-glutamate ligase-like protein [Candidatus Binatia bacterium]|nr:alpha-L-glutamate ligase-like protein [Candidatus Binatia bacterium]